MTTNQDQPAEETRQGQSAKEAAVAASTMEAAPQDQTGPQGDSFYNPALVGSGTIMPDGTYGAPLPDPNLVRLQEDPEVTTELKDQVAPDGAEPDAGTQKATAPASSSTTTTKRASRS